MTVGAEESAGPGPTRPRFGATGCGVDVAGVALDWLRLEVFGDARVAVAVGWPRLEVFGGAGPSGGLGFEYADADLPANAHVGFHAAQRLHASNISAFCALSTGAFALRSRPFVIIVSNGLA